MAGVGFGGGSSLATFPSSPGRGTTPSYGFPTSTTYLDQRLVTDPNVAAQQRSSADIANAAHAGAVDAAYRKAQLGDFYPSLQSLFASTTGTGGATGLNITAPVPRPNDAANAEAEQNARNAAFARAKDTAGNIARAAIDSLHGVASERGLNVAGGSNPLLLRGEADVIGATGNQLGEVARTQAMSDAARAAEISNRNYAGDITLRGQDLTAQAQANALAQQRWQSLLSLFGQLY